MGGVGSGGWWRWRKNGKDTVEGVHSLDVNRWNREGYLRPGLFFSWEWRYADGERATINAETRDGGVVLRYRHRQGGGEWASVDEVVPLERTRCTFGGSRPWFLCPGCRRRSAKLYGAGKFFLCRCCYDLVYECQRETQWNRALRRASKIRRRFGGGPGIAEPFPPKPKGMHGGRTKASTRRHRRRNWSAGAGRRSFSTAWELRAVRAPLVKLRGDASEIPNEPM